jgi:hypothetical protein
LLEVAYDSVGRARDALRYWIRRLAKLNQIIVYIQSLIGKRRNCDGGHRPTDAPMPNNAQESRNSERRERVAFYRRQRLRTGTVQ